MKELTAFQKKLLSEFTPTKNVYFRYDIADCEHYGDVTWAVNKVENFVKKYDGKVTDSYWDGNDCGEAWVECYIPYEHLEEVFRTGFFMYDPWQ